MITLIPKKEKEKAAPVSISDYRPISLCSSIYKVCTKLMANRLKRVLPKKISKEQGAFIAGRSISDNILLATEGHHMVLSSPPSDHMMMIKLDMEKAFDRVSWKYIEAVLYSFGFPDIWIKWTLLEGLPLLDLLIPSQSMENDPTGSRQTLGSGKAAPYPPTCSPSALRCYHASSQGNP